MLGIFCGFVGKVGGTFPSIWGLGIFNFVTFVLDLEEIADSSVSRLELLLRLKLVADCVDELLMVEVELATLLFLTSDVVEAELGWFNLLLEENPLLLRLLVKLPMSSSEPPFANKLGFPLKGSLKLSGAGSPLDPIFLGMFGVLVVVVLVFALCPVGIPLGPVFFLFGKLAFIVGRITYR